MFRRVLIGVLGGCLLGGIGFLIGARIPDEKTGEIAIGLFAWGFGIGFGLGFLAAGIISVLSIDRT